MTDGAKAPTRGKCVSFLGIALALAGAACSDGSNDPNGISSGGASAGRGGSSTAGRGGSTSSGGTSSGGTSSGGSAGSAMVDAGSEGGAAGSSTGGSSMGGASGSGGRPAGCPEPSPIPPAGQTIVIQSLNVNTAEITLRNTSSAPQSITLGRAGWQWCEFPRYWSLSEVDGILELAPGETYSFFAINNQSGQPELVVEEGEMAIYNRVQAFDDYDAVEAFVAWGDVQAFRESYAVQRGVWTFDERIEIASGHAGFIATGETDRASGYTSVPARCLVP
jgi:hypothetical protein